MGSARAASGGGGTAAAVIAAVAAAPGCAVLVLVSTSPCKLLIPAAMAVSRCCFVGGPGCAALALLSMRPGNVELELAAAPACWLPGCAAPAQLSEFCGWTRKMFTMEVTRCRLVGMPRSAELVSSRGRGASCTAAAGSSLPWSAAPSAVEAEPDEAPPRGTLSSRPGCAALTLSKGRLPVHPATAGCSALLAAPASAAGCSALLALGSTLLAAPARAAGCSALLAGAPVWPTRLARSLLPSVMTACCNSVITIGNGRRCL